MVNMALVSIVSLETILSRSSVPDKPFRSLSHNLEPLSTLTASWSMRVFTHYATPYSGNSAGLHRLFTLIHVFGARTSLNPSIEPTVFTERFLWWRRVLQPKVGS